MEEEGQEGRQLVQNPMLFDHIVKLIISYVDVESLRSCSQVCRLWEEYVLPKLLQVQKIPVVITGSRKITNFLNPQENTSEDDANSKLARYLSYRSEEPRLIFNKFTLKRMLFSAPLLDKFISTVAAEITELTLEFNEYQSPPDLKNLMGSLVNLQTLTFNTGYNKMDYSPGGIETPRTSNLKRLCLNNRGGDATSACSNLLVVMGSCRSLEELSLNFGDEIPWWDSHKYFLREAVSSCPNALVEISAGEIDCNSLEYLTGLNNLKLKALSCQSLELWGDGEKRFSGVLEKYKNTLEAVVVGEVKIRCWDRKNSEVYEIKFPDVMPKLKVFQMGMGLLTSSSHATLRTGRIRFPPVNFPVQLPSLEKLILYGGRRKCQASQSEDLDGWVYLPEFFEGSDLHPKLTKLCLPFASSKLRKSVGALFPEITSLKMETGLDESLHEISEMWPQLKSLDLTLNGYRVEDFITGTTTIKNKGPQGSSIDVDSSLSSIANLKDLKQFKLRTIGYCGEPLSDFSVSNAFCKIPFLELLLLSHHNISEEGTKELLKYHLLLKKVACPVHPEVFKIQREYLPNNVIPCAFSTEDSVAGCQCSFSK